MCQMFRESTVINGIVIAICKSTVLNDIIKAIYKSSMLMALVLIVAIAICIQQYYHQSFSIVFTFLLVYVVSNTSTYICKYLGVEGGGGWEPWST